ncbi:inositol transporter 4 [Arachis ipaensis]|uniref:inositol transporter 4 n=1 Tax=Arachis ipaensis TaxID=130454 RepID=UPI0007AF7F68|nr:inositol transporter 4 [Arachis ipaensis]XP_025668320.1 inositol transporter 4 [Arachis hypogaea]
MALDARCSRRSCFGSVHIDVYPSLSHLDGCIGSKEDEAKQILSKIYPPNEVEEEIKLMRESIETEKAEEGSIGQNLGQKLKGALANEVIRRALYAGIIVQVTQQFVGINTIMYYSPTIVQFAGIALNSTALAVSLVTSGLNAFHGSFLFF